MFAIRTGNFQLSLMLAMALAVLVLPMAAEAYPPFRLVHINRLALLIAPLSAVLERTE
jgi:hypothetical protein